MGKIGILYPAGLKLDTKSMKCLTSESEQGAATTQVSTKCPKRSRSLPLHSSCIHEVPKEV